MADSNCCHACGRLLPADAPQGLCPRCLLQQGMAIVSLQLAAITNNAADGDLAGSATNGGTIGDNGTGIGGGVYLAGTGSTKP